MKEYMSISHDGTSIYEEKKSEFLGYAYPVETEEDAIAHIQTIKKKHPDARHHVYAYALRDQNKSRYTDDGEPSGTAGMPVLDCIKKGGLTDFATGITGYNFPHGTTGLCALGNGKYYISEDKKDENGWSSTVRLYEFDETLLFVPAKE